LILKEFLTTNETVIKEFKKNDAEIKSKWSRNEIEITFLGTGAAQPNCLRNVTGIYVEMFNLGGFFLDAGEGSLTQLYRLYGNEKLTEILKNLKMIWISHDHADHQLGIPEILIERNIRGFNDKLLVIAPQNVLNFLLEYSSKVETLNFVPYVSTKIDTYEEIVEKMFDFKKFTVVEVWHCLNALAVVIESNKGWKISYSGDCRPSEQFAIVGENSDLLIHEATLDDPELAVEKNHSTIEEALEIGRKMKAKTIFINSFYSTISIVSSN